MHDDPKSERVAGWWHIGFAIAYLIAGFWHLSGARDHFRRIRKTDK